MSSNDASPTTAEEALKVMTENYEKEKKKNMTFMKVIKKQRQKINKLKEENKELKDQEYCLRQDAKGYSADEVQEYREETEELNEEINELKELTEGIMEYEHTSCIPGINCYEKFINLSAELAFSEKNHKEIYEAQVRKLKRKDNEIKELKEIENKVNAFKTMLKETCELDDDDDFEMDTWEIIEDTLKIDCKGEDIKEEDTDTESEEEEDLLPDGVKGLLDQIDTTKMGL